MLNTGQNYIALGCIGYFECVTDTRFFSKEDAWGERP